MITKQAALDYHEKPIPGKISVVPTKPCITQYDLSLAYTPGVASACLEIKENVEDVYRYTSKGNLVGVISNGTAVLGLGDIGPDAGKPVMEGKGVLFKTFADIDVFDIEVKTKDANEFINVVEKLEPTFGGINLEDIKAPECFVIERELKKRMNIPVFHDDQHGTAIISGAAILNALEIQGKKFADVKIVVSGAGAAAISCCHHYERLGATHENIIMSDIKGVVYKGRTEGMNEYMEYFAVETQARTLAEAMKGADIFLGLSAANVVTPDMVRSMADKPIVLAMANPDPEITYDAARASRKDVIVGTGRSDFPNQVNNVLGFPSIFRGALDVQATTINDEMMVAATMALVQLAREDVPDEVSQAYGGQKIRFGMEYIIPKPFDQRVLVWVSFAVAKAALETGVARKKIDLDEYKKQLEDRLERSRSLMRELWERAKANPKKIVFLEGRHEKILRAIPTILEEGLAKPILVGDEEEIRRNAQNFMVNIEGAEIVDPEKYHKKDKYVEEYYKLRQRKGVSLSDAVKRLKRRTIFAAMMVKTGDADGMVGGVSQHYQDTIKPALQIIGASQTTSVVAGMYIMVFKDTVKFLADTTVNIDPTAEQLADIAILTAKEVKKFNIKPRVALLSFSNFGSSRHSVVVKIQNAVRIIKEREPELMVDGEMNADVANDKKLLKENYPFSTLEGPANVLIFPDLHSGNIAYKLLGALAEVEMIGPVLMGMDKPVHLLQIGSSTVKDVVNMTAYAAVDAQMRR